MHPFLIIFSPFNILSIFMKEMLIIIDSEMLREKGHVCFQNEKISNLEGVNILLSLMNDI